MANKPFEFKNAKPSSTVRASKKPGVELKDGTEPEESDPAKDALNAILTAKTVEECRAHAQDALAAIGGGDEEVSEEDGQ